MIAVLCDENGMTQLGSDGYIHVDGRYSRANQINLVRQYRERFKENFPHKYGSWTHVMFVDVMEIVPSEGGNNSIMRKRQALKIRKNLFQAKRLVENYKSSTNEASWKFFDKLNKSERRKLWVKWLGLSEENPTNPTIRTIYLRKAFNNFNDCLRQRFGNHEKKTSS
jgi:hypothetical protein